VTSQQQHVTDSVPLLTSTELHTSDSLAVEVAGSRAERSHGATLQQQQNDSDDGAELQHTAHSHRASLLYAGPQSHHHLHNVVIRHQSQA